MPSLAGSKGVMMGLLTMVAYSSMVIDIIFIKKVRNNTTPGAKHYPPAVIALLISSILQLLWCVSYFVRSARGGLYKASTMAATVGFFMLFALGTTAATTALRHHEGYCAPTASNGGDCSGVLRGVEGLGFSLVGLDLIYIGFLAALVRKWGKWGNDLYNLPPIRVANADMEKGAH